jgi:DNA polymerase-3 subunit delta'
MSADFNNIVGNVELKNRISRDICDRTLAHAYIIEGPRGCGKHTLAYNIAAALSCTSESHIPCGRCKNCEKIFANKSPDIVSVGLEEDKVTMGVETVRRIRDDISTAPNDLDIKVYIIEDADAMTVQAQNAFLLSLEEPPEYVMYFLLCENSTSLLETVRSRAPTLRLQRIDTEEVKDYLLENDKRANQLAEEDEEVFKTVIHASDGCIGCALELLDSRKRKLLLEERHIAEEIISLLQSPDRAEVLGIVTTLGNKRNEVVRYLTAVEHAARDLIVLKKAENAHLCFYHNKEQAQEISTHFTSTSLMSLYSAISEAIRDLEANSNVRLTVLNMMQNAGLI